MTMNLGAIAMGLVVDGCVRGKRTTPNEVLAVGVACIGNRKN